MGKLTKARLSADERQRIAKTAVRVQAERDILVFGFSPVAAEAHRARVELALTLQAEESE